MDGEQFVCYCSTRVISKAQWIENIDNDVPDYWENEKNRMWRENADLQHHLNQIVGHFHYIKGENKQTTNQHIIFFPAVASLGNILLGI